MELTSVSVLRLSGQCNVFKLSPTDDPASGHPFDIFSTCMYMAELYKVKFSARKIVLPLICLPTLFNSFPFFLESKIKN